MGWGLGKEGLEDQAIEVLKDSQEVWQAWQNADLLAHEIQVCGAIDTLERLQESELYEIQQRKRKHQFQQYV